VEGLGGKERQGLDVRHQHPQESVVIPENIDAIRAAMQMQKDRKSGTEATNTYLGIGTWKK
jgi:glyceraldehyde-3-phosphate dehydrogenase (NAD(P))